MKIDNFKFDKDTNTISLRLDEKPVSITCQHLQNALLYKKANIILALTGEGNLPSILVGFSVEGDKKFEVGPPEGFSFYYLVDHPQADAVVVCVSEKYVEGRTDWHFSVDISSGKLSRLCPAY
ncbi:MAG TPA: hypothetical protein VIO64_19700 [Pseudobacteroides sp.]|uniref:hypothetical protein n=1 Tax=Pseudobacteroides sp. TaxID=1968840 RepID=UPI002F926C6D